ncbi:MAG: hypothetical protein QXD41_03720 [Nitrososphaeria archaeon]
MGETPAAQETPIVQSTSQVQPTLQVQATPPSVGRVGQRPEGCLSDAAMQQAHGFTKQGVKPVYTGSTIQADGSLTIPWEPCKWNLQAVGVGTVDVPMLDGWLYVAAMPDGQILVFKGDGKTRTVAGTDFRQISVYRTNGVGWVTTDEGILNHVWNFGMEVANPTYPTCPGNFKPNMTSDQQRACEPIVANNQKYCSDTTWLATNIGGDPKYWSIPTWDGGAAVYKNKNVWVTLRWPGFGRLDYWNGQKNGPDSLTSPGSVTVDEASFHCAP